MTNYASVNVQGENISGTEVDGELYEGDLSVHVSMAGEARANGAGGAEWTCKTCGGEAHEEYVNGATIYVHDDEREAESLHADYDDASDDTSDTVGGHVLADVQPVPLSWANSARIVTDENEDSVTVTISVGDPRGAFAMTIRRIPSTGELVLHVPDPSDGFLHMPLTVVRPGAFTVGS